MTESEIRNKLRTLSPLITQARKVAHELSSLVDEKGVCDEYCGLTNGLIDAEDSLLDLHELYSVRLEGHENLNIPETICYDSLNKHLRLKQEEFDSLTAPQKFSAARVLVRQGFSLNWASQNPNDNLMLKFDHILIGIEKDGYAHS